jgi:NAD(P)-dependent dehydrogenase (short-subunit alcohol dehydrogenase family)
MDNPSKVILITGCSSGFGLYTAVRLSRSGHQVIATMRDLHKKNDLVSLVQGHNLNIKILPVDVTKNFTILSAVDEIKKIYGRIDVLVNNAGYGIAGFFEDLSDQDIRDQIETNFFGVQNMTRAVLPLMREKRQGLIINISSISGLYALPCFGAYCASKWALEAFSESLLFELAPFNIHVCLVEPGIYKTKIFSENRRYAKDFFNSDSPYYPVSQILQKRTNDNLNNENKSPDEVAIMIESLICSRRPPFRNIPDRRSRLLYALKRFLPFRVYQTAVQWALTSMVKSR